MFRLPLPDVFRQKPTFSKVVLRIEDGSFKGPAGEVPNGMQARTVLKILLAGVLWVVVIFGSIFVFDELVSIVRPAGLPGEIGDSELNTFMVAGSVGAAILIGIIVFLDLSR